jgi:hypothetical protein
MILVVKRWHAVFSALLFFLPRGAAAAEDPGGAARELARKTAAFAGRGEAVSASWRNVSSLSSGDFNQVRSLFETALREAGARAGDTAAAEAHITVSENRSHYLMVEEARRGEERQVWIAAWPRATVATTGAASPGIALEKKLVWEQTGQILDLAFPPGGMLVLSPSQVALYARRDAEWELRQALPFASSKPLPRDARGRLRVTGASFKAYVPGTLCSGTLEPLTLTMHTMECRPSEEPWVLESGSRAFVLANFAPQRNHFDGRVVTQTGQRKTVAPFYSAAAAEDQGRQFWLLAMLDGHTQIFDAVLDPVDGAAGGAPTWGSDIAGTGARCGGGSQVLATRPGDAGQPDAVQAFAVLNRVPTSLTAPLEFAGPVTALWTSNGSSAIAIVHDVATGKYAAYLLSVLCE